MVVSRRLVSSLIRLWKPSVSCSTLIRSSTSCASRHTYGGISQYASSASTPLSRQAKIEVPGGPQISDEFTGQDAIGHVCQVVDTLVDVKFKEGLPLPQIRTALEVLDHSSRLVLEVADHLGEGVVRTIAMSPTEGVARGWRVLNTGSPITVPVGRVTLGRVMNVIGETIDDYGELKAEKMLPIYRKAPSFYERNKTPVILQTGIKVIDMLAPYQRGGNIGLIGCAGVGKSILMMELMNIVADIYGGLSVFAGIKEQSQEGEDLYRRMVSDGIIKLGDKQSQSKCAFVCGQINDPPGARSRVVYTGLTVAEGFRDEGRKVLLFVDNHFRFTQADSELSTLLGRIPSAVGYQPTLSIDIHSLQERIAATSKSFITSFHTIYPGDDVDVHLDAATVFSKEIFDRGIYPAIDPLKSTSSLLSPHCLHEDHFEVADGVIRNLQHYKNLQDIIAILGVDELSEDDQLIITRARKIELFLGQPLSVVAYPRSQETYVHLDDTLKGFQGLLDGEYDYIPDAYFHMTCGIKDVIAAYENHLLAGMQCN